MTRIAGAPGRAPRWRASAASQRGRLERRLRAHRVDAVAAAHDGRRASCSASSWRDSSGHTARGTQNVSSSSGSPSPKRSRRTIQARSPSAELQRRARGRRRSRALQRIRARGRWGWIALRGASAPRTRPAAGACARSGAARRTCPSRAGGRRRRGARAARPPGGRSCARGRSGRRSRAPRRAGRASPDRRRRSAAAGRRRPAGTVGAASLATVQRTPGCQWSRVVDGRRRLTDRRIAAGALRCRPGAIELVRVAGSAPRGGHPDRRRHGRGRPPACRRGRRRRRSPGRRLPRRDRRRAALAGRGDRRRRRGGGRRSAGRVRGLDRGARGRRRRPGRALLRPGRQRPGDARTGMSGSRTTTISSPSARTSWSRSSGTSPATPSSFTIGIGPWISVGFNSAGLALTGNELSPNDDRVGIPRLLLVRDILRRRTLDEAVAAALHPRRASSYNNLLSHRDGGVVSVEGSATDAELLRPDGRHPRPHQPLHERADGAATSAIPRTTAGSRARQRSARGWLAARPGHAGAPARRALRPRGRAGLALPPHGARRRVEDCLLVHCRRHRRNGPIRSREPLRLPRAAVRLCLSPHTATPS